MEILIVRHCEPDYEKDSLTQKGVKEAKLLAERLSQTKMDYIYVSPLGRAQKTASYTPKIVQYSEYYRTFSNVLQIRTIRAEYLVAMKLVSGRQYKKDLSDIAGIVYEQQMAGKPLTYELIDKAVCNLYGNWDNIEKYARDLLDRILACDDLQSLFIELSEDEKAAKEALAEMVKKYPTVVKQDNVNDVIAATLKKKRQREER